MSASGESPADEAPSVANNPEDNIETGVAKDAVKVETETSMLEDEEMPTYMSLTVSSKTNESRVQIELPQPPKIVEEMEAPMMGASPCASDDHDGGSVYVVSSGEESNDKPYYEEYYESDEMDMDEEDEEDADDDDRTDHNEEDEEKEEEEESDGDIEPEQFERSSDDFVLRYDNGLDKLHKKRSRSLQDLTNSRGNLSRFVGKRCSIDFGGQYEPDFQRESSEYCRDPLGDSKKNLHSMKYDHVPSKVKKYIQDIKEQSRRSAERNLKNRDNPANNDATVRNTKSENKETPCSKLNPASRVIKGYVQNAIKQMVVEDHPNIEDVTYGGRRVGENGTEMLSMPIIEETKETSVNDTLPQVDKITENQKNSSNNTDKFSKLNGLSEYSGQNHDQDPLGVCMLNGQDQSGTILNLRTLSYEEYTNGGQKSDIKAESKETLSQVKEERNSEIERMEEEVTDVIQTETASVPTSFKSDSVNIAHRVPEPTLAERESLDLTKSVRRELEMNNRESIEVALLKSQLNQKSAQFNGIREVYQKTLAENFDLKRELDEMKKTLAQYRAENQPRETSVASVQTEIFVEPVPSKTTEEELKPLIPKLSISSVGSVQSSIEQWSDSNCSPAISINPPNIDNVLNSDDSYAGAERTPRRTVRPLSRAFITSSRILQTLSNITQGRTKTASPLAAAGTNISRLGAEQGQSKQETNTPFVSGNEASTLRAKKRKASDVMGLSGYLKPFKMPNTPGEPRRKMNSASDTDAVFMSPRESPRVRSVIDPNIGKNGTADENSERVPEDREDTEAIDVPENVKCFVYHEESSSKDRSFLIQAEEPTKNNKAEIKGGTVRECGPYLLGNVEIRMSEANGTINIWGKEVSRDSADLDADEDMDVAETYDKPSGSRRASLDDPKTPRDKFVSGTSFMCSTNKKSKLSPQLGNRSGLGKYFRTTLSSNVTRSSAFANDEEAERCINSDVLNNHTIVCDKCESHKKQRIRCRHCDHCTESRPKQHSCCLHGSEVNEKDSDRERSVLDDAALFETVSNILAAHKKCSASLHSTSMKYSCADPVHNITCKHQTSMNHHSHEQEEECHHTNKRCTSCIPEATLCNHRLTPENASSRESRSRPQSRVSSCEDDDHPLILNGKPYETPEITRRRLSGKKVRGILMDLLRGCGDCRNPSSASLNRTEFLSKEAAELLNLNPTVRLPSCSTSHPSSTSCTKRSTPCETHSRFTTPDNGTEKCCNICSRRIEKAAEVENQLEIFRIEMEKLRAHSDTVLNMLDTLHAAETK